LAAPLTLKNRILNLFFSERSAVVSHVLLSGIQIFNLVIILILPYFFHFGSVLLRLANINELIYNLWFLKLIRRNPLQLLAKRTFFYLNSLILLVSCAILNVFIKNEILLAAYSSLFALKWVDKWLTVLSFIFFLVLAIQLNFSGAWCYNHLFLILFILNIFLHPKRLTYIQFQFLFLIGLCLYFICFKLSILCISVIKSVVWQWVIQLFQNLLFRYFFIFGSILLFDLFQSLLNFLLINLKFWFI
jgi:hypothetical protein